MKKWKLRMIAWAMLVILGIGSVILPVQENPVKVKATLVEVLEEAGYKSHGNTIEGDFNISIYKNAMGDTKKIVSEYLGTDSVVKFPEVDGIWHYAFYDNKEITEIIIPSSIEWIGDDAFAWCDNLERITFLEGNEDGTLYIAPDAFSTCTKLKELCFPKRKDYLLEEGAFICCENIEKITFPEAGIITIGKAVFGNVKALKTLGFEGYKGLNIKSSGFWNCENLTELVLPECHSDWKILPDGGVRLGSGAFSECSQLERVVLPNSLVSMEEDAFERSEKCKFTVSYNSKGFEVLSKNINNKINGYYYMTFDASGGTVDPEVMWVSETAETYPMIPVPKREGCIFEGWYGTAKMANGINVKVEKPETGKMIAVRANTKLQAVWKEEENPVAPTDSITTEAPVEEDKKEEAETACPEKTTSATPLETELPKETMVPTNVPSDIGKIDETKDEITDEITDETKSTFETATPSPIPETTKAPEGTKLHFHYNTQGGILSSAFDSDTVRLGEQFSDLETATRKGYIFDGWYTEPEGGRKIENGMVCDEVVSVLYAHWAPNSYTLQFDGNFGTVDTDTKTVTYGKAYGSLPIPRKEGSVFKGWYTRTNLGQLVTAEDVFVEEQNQCLYAVWEFNAKGGKAAFIRKLVKQGGAYGSLPSATKEGYVFDGWYTDSVGGMKITADTISYLPGKQVLYAHWIKEEKIEPTPTVVINTSTPGNVPSPSTEPTSGSALEGTTPPDAVSNVSAGKTPGPTTTAEAGAASAKPITTTTPNAVKKVTVGTGKLLNIKSSKKGSVKITWKKVKNAKGYVLELSTHKKFKKNTTKKKTAKSVYTINKLKSGKTYYVRVRAYKLNSKKQKVYGKYSSVKKIKIK